MNVISLLFGTFGLMLLLGAPITLALGVASMSMTAYHQLDRSGDQTVATALGQQRIEWLRNQGYASADLNAGTTRDIHDTHDLQVLRFLPTGLVVYSTAMNLQEITLLPYAQFMLSIN